MKPLFIGDLHADSRKISSRIDDSREVLIDKLEQIRKFCVEDGVTDIFLEGDVFNRPSVAPECISKLGGEFMRFSADDVAVHTIVGNHDILRNDLKTLQDSALGLLGQFGVIDIMTESFEKDGIRVIPCHYTQTPEPAPADGMINILVGHMFFDKNEMFTNDFGNNLPRENVEKLNCRYIFLGHDHESYSTVKVGGTEICRTGSLIRMNRTAYNYTRIPEFAVLEDDGVHIHKLECAPFDEIVAGKTEKASADSVMANLASRLASGNSETEDTIMEKIMKDEALSADCRELLLSYINEEA